MLTNIHNAVTIAIKIAVAIFTTAAGRNKLSRPITRAAIIINTRSTTNKMTINSRTFA